MVEEIAKVAVESICDGGKFAESLNEDVGAGKDFAESLKEDTGAGKEFADFLKGDSAAGKEFAESLKEDTGAGRDFADFLKGDSNAGKEFAESLKEDASSGKDFEEPGKDSNEPDDKEKLNPKEYLTKEQIDTIKQKYKELGYSDEEIEAKVQEYAQKAKACKEAEERGLDSLDNKQKGNYGEMKTDLDMLDKGYVRISKDSITSLDDKGHRGIDGVYENPNGKPKFSIIDSKYGSSQLSETKDGTQMSDEWIDRRLDESVGKDKADEIRAESIENPDNVDKAVAHIDSEGNVEYTDVDSPETGDTNND